MKVAIPRQIMEIIYNENINYDSLQDGDVISATNLVSRIKTQIHKLNHIVKAKDIEFSFDDYRQMQILIVLLNSFESRNHRNYIANWVRAFRRDIEKFSPENIAASREKNIKETAPKILSSAINKLNQLCASHFPDMGSSFSPKSKIVWDKRKLNSESGYDIAKGSKFGDCGLIEITIRKKFSPDYIFQKSKLSHICGVADDKRFGDFETTLWQIYLLTDICYHYHNVVCEYRKLKLKDSSFDSYISKGSMDFYILIREKILNPILIKNKIKVGV